jgi:hypothetical protein
MIVEEDHLNSEPHIYLDKAWKSGAPCKKYLSKEKILIFEWHKKWLHPLHPGLVLLVKLGVAD